MGRKGGGANPLKEASQATVHPAWETGQVGQQEKGMPNLGVHAAEEQLAAAFT